MDFSAGKWILIGLAMLIASAAVGYFSFAPPVESPPQAVLDDPVLLEGRSVFMSRCVPCHGAAGKGNGPMAASFGGEQVGDLTDGKWKHGDKPEDVLRVIRVGVSGTRMAPWGALLDDDQIRCVAAYCYFLSALPVPESLREADPGPAAGPR
ncbi:c-type cytochrome [Planctomyces sp. SH-PL62]|uniref:c-type cytochrome n=1 Tax=Planctomyces sp. SH-PL62 TaxID=1636152 RepID=UPI00078C86FF|nr:c-type cytochrome [Planctomyces sp. SH-PL62]AMV39080.1 Cbb3-type cytochrome c oxidase subunit CcoP2 [Planctomyces sp. SH-PL62]